jgi:hypothetical protein
MYPKEAQMVATEDEEDISSFAAIAISGHCSTSNIRNTYLPLTEAREVLLAHLEKMAKTKS